MKLIKASGSQFRLLIPGAVTTFFFLGAGIYRGGRWSTTRKVGGMALD